MENNNYRIESLAEVKAYIQNLKYALNNGAQITFQLHRIVDDERDIRYTNQYTIDTLFPDENPIDAIKRELNKLTYRDYIRTVGMSDFQTEVR